MEGNTVASGRYRKANALEFHIVDDQCIVYDPGTDRIHYLNPTASLVLELCDGSRSADDMAKIVQEAYGLPVPPMDEIIGCLQSLVAVEMVS
jgi:hypothetical protein